MKLHQINEAYTPDLGKLYHGTFKSKLPQILRDGLDPQYSMHAEDEELNDYDGFGPPYHFVYLSDSPGIAETFAPGGEYNTHDASDKAMLEITLPPELQKKLIIDRGEFIRAPFVIPPQYIHVIQ